MKVLPAPRFAGSEKVAVQQGAGMVVTTGTEAEINGAVTFLKWFTEPQNNIEFSVESGYLPVTTAANDMDAIRASGLELTDNMEQTLSGAVKTVRENELYTPTAFAGGNAVRKMHGRSGQCRPGHGAGTHRRRPERGSSHGRVFDRRLF